MIDNNNRIISFGIIFLDNMQVIDNITIEINQDIRIVDTKAWKVYEQYTINKNIFRKLLGYFDGSFDYIQIIKLPFIERRSSLNGYHLKAITEIERPFISIDLGGATYDEASQTYDVTKSVTGMFFDIFLEMQEYLNFTYTLHKRKDGKWGPTKILANGTIIAGGIVESLTSGFAEMAATRFVVGIFLCAEGLEGEHC